LLALPLLLFFFHDMKDGADIAVVTQVQFVLIKFQKVEPFTTRAFYFKSLGRFFYKKTTAFTTAFILNFGSINQRAGSLFIKIV